MIGLVDAEVFLRPAFFARAGGVEVDLIGHERGRDQADGEVPVQARALDVGNEAVADAMPVGVKVQAGGGEHQQRQAAVAEDPLDPVKRQKP
jgi:hypothetical protein